MKFVEVTGAMLMKLTDADQASQLRNAGVTDESKIRINPQGDIEMLENGAWSIIGGLLGDYEHRIKRMTGLDWS